MTIYTSATPSIVYKWASHVYECVGDNGRPLYMYVLACYNYLEFYTVLL